MARRMETAAREALLSRRHELLGLRRRHQDAEAELLTERAPDPLDQAAVHSDADFLELLSRAELAELAEINRALQRIEAGRYGACEACDEPISARRLEALPWAALCVECAADLEAQASRYATVR